MQIQPQTRADLKAYRREKRPKSISRSSRRANYRYTLIKIWINIKKITTIRKLILLILIMTIFINSLSPPSIMPREDKTFSPLSIDSLILLSGAFIPGISSVIPKETFQKDVISNTLSLNLTKEAQKQELEGTCMRSFLQENLQMAPGETRLSEILENQSMKTKMEKPTKKESSRLTSQN